MSQRITRPDRFVSWYDWLKAQEDRPNMLGDVARLIVRDRNFPRRYSPDVQFDYLLKRKKVPTDTIEAFKRSWHLYLREYCFEEQDIRDGGGLDRI